VTTGTKSGFFQALARDLRDDSSARGQRLLFVSDALQRALHAGGNVLHRLQDVYFKVWRLHLQVRRWRVEAVAHIVMLRRRILLQLSDGYMMVG
jgi:hypothetical protein